MSFKSGVHMRGKIMNRGKKHKRENTGNYEKYENLYYHIFYAVLCSFGFLEF